MKDPSLLVASYVGQQTAPADGTAMADGTAVAGSGA
jgi:hypothetical protein